jgi:hypothetical protein
MCRLWQLPPLAARQLLKGHVARGHRSSVGRLHHRQLRIAETGNLIEILSHCRCNRALFAIAFCAALGSGYGTIEPAFAADSPIVETASFRIVGLDAKMASQTIAACCEQMREELALRWLDEKAEGAWMPKCDVVLHASEESYLREVGRGGRNTVASSVIDRDGRRVLRRRIDLLAANARWSASTLGHELTHLVLADVFADKKLPRWLDEGIAILADSPTKQSQHRRDLHLALRKGVEFRVLELVSLADYPPAERWGTFYGQSASLVQFLVEQGDERQFVEFVRIALDEGYDRGLRRVYGCAMPELERQWRSQLGRQAVPYLSRKSAPSAPHGPVRAEIQPVSLEIR